MVLSPRNKTPHKAENSEVRSLLRNCNVMLCQPTGGLARLTEGCSFRRKVRGTTMWGGSMAGVAGEQPNRIQQPNGRDGNQIDGVNG